MTLKCFVVACQNVLSLDTNDVLLTTARSSLRDNDHPEGNNNTDHTEVTEPTNNCPSLCALLVLLRPGLLTLSESAIHYALYLWLVTTIMIVALGSTEHH